MSDNATTAFVCPSCARPATGMPGDRCPHDAHVLVPTKTRTEFPNDRVLGRVLGFDLRVFDVLADTGGFGRVYRALQPALRREVVLKVLRADVAERPGARDRMLREARLLARLSHVPGIVTVHDCFTTEDDLLCLVMARAPGQTLARVLADGPLMPDRARNLTAAILNALHAAHGHGLVHRDLKPDNILVDGTHVTLIDFGIAKDLAPQTDDMRTASGVHLGTPRYMAPEQLQRGGAIGAATDLYAAGVLLYEMLTGQTPFDGSPAELMAAHMYSAPPPVFDAELNAVVQRAMQKDPQSRYADAEAMRLALHAGLAPPLVGDATRTGTVDSLIPPSAPRPRWPWIAGGLVALIGLVVWLIPGDPDPAEPPVTALNAPVSTAPVSTAPVSTAPVTVATHAPDMQVNAPAPDAAIPDMAVDAAPPSRLAVAPKSKRPRRRRPRTLVSAAPKSIAPPVRAPESTAPPRATPVQIAAVRAALKVCRCDRARVEMRALRDTVDAQRWRAAVARCRPKLVGQKCAYSEP